MAGTASNAILLGGFPSSSYTFTSSFNTLSSSVSSQLSSLQTTSGSNIGRLNNLEAATSSYAISSSVAAVDLAQNNRLSSIESVTSSYAISSSVATVDAGQNSRLSQIESVTSSLNAATSSYAKLSGGNTFTGTQIISASVYMTGDLVVQGSSSIQYISASSVSIGTNIVNLNTATPAVRFAGISVQDSGSNAGVTGSIFWDSVCNKWIYSNPDAQYIGWTSI